jgi:hypothetical protein
VSSFVFFVGFSENGNVGQTIKTGRREAVDN